MSPSTHMPSVHRCRPDHGSCVRPCTRSQHCDLASVQFLGAVCPSLSFPFCDERGICGHICNSFTFEVVQGTHQPREASWRQPQCKAQVASPLDGEKGNSGERRIVTRSLPCRFLCLSFLLSFFRLFVLFCFCFLRQGLTM